MKKSKIPLLIMVILLIIAVAGVIIVINHKNKNQIPIASAQTQSTDDANKTLEKWQEGIITYKGKDYIYNQNLSVYYLMGIDKDEKVEKAPDYLSGGQSDANFLLVADKTTKQLSVFAINRNAMTEVEIYGITGDYLGTETRQLTIQHAYGDGMKLSCNLSVEAVEKLFYNIPISGYMAINMGAIPAINDAAGGVEVTVLPGTENLTEGETVTLNGEQAYWYVRYRDCGEFDSASMRLERQEQYVSAYLQKLKEDSSVNVGAAMSLYQAIKDYLVTDVDFEKLVTELLQYDYNPERMYSVPGETKMSDSTEFEEFYVDEDAFYDLIIQVFYTEV